MSLHSHFLSVHLFNQEADSYIKNLIMKFGSFNFAEPFTVLHGNCLDRHLYDMLPNAWKHPEIPAPIPKTAPAASARRKTVITRRKTITSIEPKLVASNSGGVRTRCTSMVIDDDFDMNRDSTTFDQPSMQPVAVMSDAQPVSQLSAPFSTSKSINQAIGKHFHNI